ncbi:hypothetical protein CP8484711_0677, partial [Chlamydia psittaci 84-8471/1]
MWRADDQLASSHEITTSTYLYLQLLQETILSAMFFK